MLLVLVRFALLPSMILLLGFSAYAETKPIEVNDPRPVAKAVERLEAIYGIPITYEDPPYVNDGEILDVTAQVRRDQGTNKVLVPRGGTFVFTYDAPSTSGTERLSLEHQAALRVATSNAIAAALYSHTTFHNAEVFKVVQDNDSFHVVPTRFTNASGQLEQIQPILDTRVSASPKQANGAALVSEICQSLSVATRQTVVVGTVPWAQLATHATTITAVDESARSALSRLLAEMPVALSWQLFYDPGLHWYVLNIHSVDSVRR